MSGGTNISVRTNVLVSANFPVGTIVLGVTYVLVRNNVLVIAYVLVGTLVLGATNVQGGINIQGCTWLVVLQLTME